ncbi:MAG: OsmC family protein [Ferruginibacter sp.]
MDKTHHYSLSVKWTGNKGPGTRDYQSYERSHIILVDNKAGIAGSSDPSFRGDKTMHNPEELFIASLSACHMLWYLHLCADAGIIVTDYLDRATGTMVVASNGSGRFTQVLLHPTVTITDESRLSKADELHHTANEYCYIANSCNFPVLHEPVFIVNGI